MNLSLKLLFIISLSTINIWSKEFNRNLHLNEQLPFRASINFIENKGQLKDMNGKIVPDVLFKTTIPNLDFYITTTGLSYVYRSVEEEEKKEKSQFFDFFKGLKKIQQDEKEIKWSRIEMKLIGAFIKKENIIREDASQVDYHFFQAHCPNGILNVKEYKKITIKDIYPGIDWVIYNSSERGVKYDFIVHPGANPSVIKIAYLSKNRLKFNANGDINIETKQGKLVEHAPESFLNKNLIPSKFKLLNCKSIKDGFNTLVGFEFPTNNFLANKNETLIIDPQLTWSTFYGNGNALGFTSTTTDLAGNLFVTGYNNTAPFPTVDAGSGSFFEGTYRGGSSDAVILKFNNTNQLIWATLFGGNNFETANDITCDANGNLFIVGQTASTDIPTLDAGHYFQNQLAGSSDAFILKFSNNGILIWSTYYGGASNTDIAYSLCTDTENNILITGSTSSTNFPTFNPGNGAYFQANGPGTTIPFILKFDNIGTQLWATYYGMGTGVGYSICTDSANNIFLTGGYGPSIPLLDAGTYFQTNNGSSDAFIAKFDRNGVRSWSTCLGGSGIDYAYSMACDHSNQIFILGKTNSPNFPTYDAGNGAYFDNSLNGTNDAFIAKFDNNGNQLWTTYFGGNSMEYDASPHGITYNTITISKKCGNVFVSFETSSTDINTLSTNTSDYFDNTFNGGAYDQFVCSFTNDCKLTWASYFGGSGDDFRTPITLDNDDNLFLAGEWTLAGATNSSTYPILNTGNNDYFDATNSGSDDGFIAKFSGNIHPNAQFTISPLEGCNPLSISLQNTSVYSDYYQWDFGNMYKIDSTTEITVQNQLYDSSAIIHLIAYNNVGCSDDTIILVTVYNCGCTNPNALNYNPNATFDDGSCLFPPDPTIEPEITEIVYDLPNVFTPEGDNKNDLFMIPTKNCKLVKFTVFNRWGNMVYEGEFDVTKNEAMNGWNGEIEGKPATSGIYYFSYKIIGLNNKEINGSSFFTLLRK